MDGDRSDVSALVDRAIEQGEVLPQVLADTPAAILVIDLRAGTVTYANPVARDMTEVQLPCPVDRWGRAADLRDLGGDALEDSVSPLSRIATGRPVAGEPVRLGSDDEARLLWVTGFPLSAEGSLEQLALVALFEVDGDFGHQGDGRSGAGRLAALRDRAVVATDLAFSISDPHQPDHPLVWVNPAFTRMTGYGAEEAVGRNCRFLQGDARDQAELDTLRRALESQQPVTVTLVNFRKDGSAFYNQLSVSPVFDADDRLINYVGVQTDVTTRVRAERERAAAFEAERSARAAAEEARRVAERSRAQLALLAESTALLSGTLDVDEALERLMGLAVPVLADWVVLHRVRDDELGDMVLEGRHRDPAGQKLLDRLLPLLAEAPSAPVRLVLAGGGPCLVDETVDTPKQLVQPAAHALLDELAPESIMVAPLAAAGKVWGAMSFISTEPGRRYDASDLALVTDLGRRAAMSVENASMYQAQRQVALELQRVLLPRLTDRPGLQVAPVYQPSNRAARIGGDFYDLVQLPDGAISLSVGDVMGHDLPAAAAMGQLRGVLRSYAYEGAVPGAVLTRTDALVQGLGLIPLATVVHGRLEPAGDGFTLSWSNAGHPPPLLRRPDGTSQWLVAEPEPLLGVTDVVRSTHSVELTLGSTLVLYTDGLVERRSGEGDERGPLQRAVDALPADAGAAAVCRAALQARPADNDDDVAVLVVRVVERLA